MWSLNARQPRQRCGASVKLDLLSDMRQPHDERDHSHGRREITLCACAASAHREDLCVAGGHEEFVGLHLHRRRRPIPGGVPHGPLL